VIASAFGSVHNFFHSGTWYAVRDGALGLVLLFWLATVFWVVKDARRRIRQWWLIAVCVLLAVVVPFIGPLIYMLFRPPEYLEDVHERQLEIRAIEQRLGMQSCPVCNADTEPEYLVCPVCATRLRHPCTTCRRPLDSGWQVCPYCETPVTPAEHETVLDVRRKREQRRAAGGV
jgi:hypothetical protein